MKTTRLIIHLICLFGILILQVSCEKDKYFDSEGGGIKGLVMYRNAITNVIDTARNAEVVIQGPHRGQNKGKTFNLQTVNGRFDANFLKDGNYSINIHFLAHERVYRLDTMMRPQNGILRELVLKLVDDNDYGTASLQGTVQFQDLKSDLLANAAKAEVELLQGNLRFRTVADENGKFVFEDLPGGFYLVSLLLREAIEGEQVQYRAELPNHEVGANQINKQLALSLGLDTGAIANPLIKVKVLDDSQARLGQVEVFLYANEKTLRGDSLRTKALAKKTSNDRGIALFTHLDKMDYFVYARIIRGEDTLSLRGTHLIKWESSHNFIESILNFP